MSAGLFCVSHVLVRPRSSSFLSATLLPWFGCHPCRRHSAVLSSSCSVVARAHHIVVSTVASVYLVRPRSAFIAVVRLFASNSKLVLLSLLNSTSFLSAFRSRRVSVPSSGHILDTPAPIGFPCDMFLIWKFWIFEFSLDGGIVSCILRLNTAFSSCIVVFSHN
jgi:hypothetical protein